MKTPAKVMYEITSNKVVTKIFDENDRVLAKLVTKRTDYGFSRKHHSIDDKAPGFLSEVDGFHCTSIANELRDLADGLHPDQFDGEVE